MLLVLVKWEEHSLKEQRGDVELWDLRTQQHRQVTTVKYSPPLWKLDATPDFEILVMKKDSESVCTYGGDAHEEIGSIQIESILDVGAVGVSPDGKTIALSHGTEISLWDLGTVRDLYGNGRSASLSHASGPLVGHGRRVSHLELSSPDRGERGLLFSASIDQTIRVWDVASRETRSILRGHTDEVGLMSLSPNGTELASVSREGTIKIWPVRSPGIPRQVILREPADVTFSRDGRRLITADCSADNSGHVRLREWNWDRESLSEIQDEGTTKSRAASLASEAHTLKLTHRRFLRRRPSDMPSAPPSHALRDKIVLRHRPRDREVCSQLTSLCSRNPTTQSSSCTQRIKG